MKNEKRIKFSTVQEIKNKRRNKRKYRGKIHKGTDLLIVYYMKDFRYWGEI